MDFRRLCTFESKDTKIFLIFLAFLIFLSLRRCEIKPPSLPFGRKVAFMSVKLCALFLVAGEFHQISLDERVEIAVHHASYVGGLVAGAVVLDAAVVKHV